MNVQQYHHAAEADAPFRTKASPIAKKRGMFSRSLRWMRSACATAGCSISLACPPKFFASSGLTKALFFMRAIAVWLPVSSILIARMPAQVA